VAPGFSFVRPACWRVFSFLGGVMSLSDWIVSWLRTLAAAWIPTLAAWLASFGVELPVEPATLAVTSVIVTAYYTVVRALEARWPWVGVLLLVKRQPTYEQDQRLRG